MRGVRTHVLVWLFACLAVGGGAAAAPAATSPPSAEWSRPDATLQLSEGRISTGLAYMWGRGRLNFQDRHHDFQISGAPVASVNARRLSATGQVYHLTRLSDFSGKYVALECTQVPSSECDAEQFRNEHGVVILLQVGTTGAQRGRVAGDVRIHLNE
jgi:hypothetical protein